MKTTSLIALLILSTSSLYAVEGCFTVTGQPGKCHTGTVQCSFNSGDDHAAYGVTVGDLCDQLAEEKIEGAKLERSLQECGANYNEVLGVQATDAVNYAVCTNQQTIQTRKLDDAAAVIAKLQKQVFRLERKLRRKRSR